MKAKQQTAQADLLPPLEVRVVQYDRRRMRLMQLLIPIAGLATVLGRAFESALAFIPSLAFTLSGLALCISARKSEVGRIRALPERIKVAGTTVRPGEFGRWRWYDRHATLFALSANLHVKTRSRVDAESLRLMLLAILGEPLRYRRRGSLRALAIAALVTVVAFVLSDLAFKWQNEALMVFAPLSLFAGLGTLGALSQTVLDVRPTPKPE